MDLLRAARSALRNEGYVTMWRRRVVEEQRAGVSGNEDGEFV